MATYLKLANRMCGEHRVDRVKRKTFTWWRLYTSMRRVKVGKDDQIRKNYLYLPCGYLPCINALSF